MLESLGPTDFNADAKLTIEGTNLSKLAEIYVSPDFTNLTNAKYNALDAAIGVGNNDDNKNDKKRVIAVSLAKEGRAWNEGKGYGFVKLAISAAADNVKISKIVLEKIS
jgi:hypothetical protein